MFAEWPEYHLGSMPLTVLSATRRSPPPDEVWPAGRLVAEIERLRRDLATRSDRARREWVESGHAIHLDAPEIVVRAIEAAVTPGG